MNEADPCPGCGIWPHKLNCLWRDASVVRCGPWIVCAACGMRDAHRHGCNAVGAVVGGMPADAAPVPPARVDLGDGQTATVAAAGRPAAGRLCVRCGLVLEGPDLELGQLTHPPDTCVRLLRVAAFSSAAPPEPPDLAVIVRAEVRKALADHAKATCRGCQEASDHRAMHTCELRPDNRRHHVPIEAR